MYNNANQVLSGQMSTAVTYGDQSVPQPSGVQTAMRRLEEAISTNCQLATQHLESLGISSPQQKVDKETVANQTLAGYLNRFARSLEENNMKLQDSLGHLNS